LPKTTARRGGVNAPDIANLREILAQMCGGQDLTQLPALTHYGVSQLIGEAGTDLTIWPTEKHFTVWLGLAPGSNDSGKHKGRVKRNRNRAEQLFFIPRRCASKWGPRVRGRRKRSNSKQGSQTVVLAKRTVFFPFCDSLVREDDGSIF
jgi:transposase